MTLPAFRRRPTADAGRPSGPLVGHRRALGAVCFLAAFISLRSATPAPTGGMAQSFNADNVKASFFVPGETIPRFGFVPVRVSIQNQQTRELRWEADFSQNSFSNTGTSSTMRSNLPLTVPASRNVDRWMFIPTSEPGLNRSGGGYYSRWGNFTLTVDGTGIREKILHFNANARGGTQMVPWAVSASLENAVRTHLVGLRTPTPPMMRPGSRTPGPPGMRALITGAPNLFVFDPVQSWPDWRVWSPFARVILRSDEYATLPPANRSALRNWVAMGGTLYLTPEGGPPGERQHFGAGVIIPLEQPISGAGAHDSQGLFNPDAIFQSTSAIPNELSLQKSGLSERIPAAKLVGDWLVYFFVGFAVLVAPVNLFAIAPVRRRHWLFLTVPAISVAAVAILAVAIYLQDGVGGEGARRAVVVLLPGDNQAAVFQEQVARTGLLFGTSFPLADDTVCAAVPAEDSNRQPGRPLEYNRNDGRATGDWFRGRARQALHLRRLTPTRARIEQVGAAPDGAPIVQSSVAAVLRGFFYRDARGQYWTAEQLPPGKQVALQRVASNETAVRRVTEFASVATPEFSRIVNNIARHWAANHFVAVADDFELAPLVTLASIRWKDSAVLLTGTIESAAPAAGRANP